MKSVACGDEPISSWRRAAVLGCNCSKQKEEGEGRQDGFAHDQFKFNPLTATLNINQPFKEISIASKKSLICKVAVEPLGSSFLVNLVEIAVLWNLSAQNTHNCVLVHYVPSHVLHPPVTLLTSLRLPSQPEVVKLGQNRPLESPQA